MDTQEPIPSSSSKEKEPTSARGASMADSWVQEVCRYLESLRRPDGGYAWAVRGLNSMGAGKPTATATVRVPATKAEASHTIELTA